MSAAPGAPTFRYTFDNATDDAADQVRLLGEILDAHTSDVRDRAGVSGRGVTVEQLTTLREGMADPHTLAWSYLMVTGVGRRGAG